MENEEKTFDHKTAEISDKIALLSELEHLRAHAIRSAEALFNPDEPTGDTRWIHYAIIAEEAKRLRREYQKEHFGELSEYDWCLCKVASRLRQLAYETQESDWSMLKRIDDLVDEVWGAALDMDLSSCAACREDKGEI